MVCNKVVKIALICDQIDKDGKDVNYNDIYKLLWDLQKQTREAKKQSNKTLLGMERLFK